MLIPLVTYNLLLLFALLLPAGKLINSKKSGLIRYETDGFNWNIRLTFILFYIVIVAGSRGEDVGTDYIHYLAFYDYILTYGEIGYHFKENEIGWVYLNLLFGKLGVPSAIFFGLISGITWFFFIKGSYKFQFLLPLMFFFVITSGFFFWTFNGLRQSIAIMIFFYAIRFIVEKNLLHYALWISIASLFHISAIIMLPFYFIKKVKFNQKLIALLYIISIFLVGNGWIMSAMGDIIIFVASKIDLLSNYVRYLGTDTYAENEERVNSGLGVLVRIAATIYIIYKSDYVLKEQPKLKIYYIMFFIGTILSNIFFAVPIIGRITIYFNISFAIVMASTIYYSTNKHEQVINTLLIMTYFAMFSRQLYKVFGA